MIYYLCYYNNDQVFFFVKSVFYFTVTSRNHSHTKIEFIFINSKRVTLQAYLLENKNVTLKVPTIQFYFQLNDFILKNNNRTHRI